MNHIYNIWLIKESYYFNSMCYYCVKEFFLFNLGSSLLSKNYFWRS